MSGARYFDLAQRTFAFSGVMAARADAQREEAERPTPSTTPTRTQASQPYQSIEALALQHPGEIELVKVDV